MVVPSFAVGRTQELLVFYPWRSRRKNLLPDYPNFEVYVDSPLAIESNERI